MLGSLHTPLSHLAPVSHFLQAIPPEPQKVGVSPFMQVSPSQQPVAQLLELHLSPVTHWPSLQT